jgi:GTP-binding protein EngB required for normal cell division
LSIFIFILINKLDKAKKSMKPTTFAEIVEKADELPLDAQESLIIILQNRLRERRRAERVRDVQEAQQEFAQGKCQPVTPEQLMEEILG